MILQLRPNYNSVNAFFVKLNFVDNNSSAPWRTYYLLGKIY